jgi:glycerol uptake facilitator-like aquaporin
LVDSFSGVASVASFILDAAPGGPVPVTAYSSFFQIGFAFALGIMFAIIVAGPTSGGHFNPAITISLAICQGFPWKKVPHCECSSVTSYEGRTC